MLIRANGRSKPHENGQQMQAEHQHRREIGNKGGKVSTKIIKASIRGNTKTVS